MNRFAALKAMGVSLTLGTLPFVAVCRDLLYPRSDRYFEYSIPSGEFAGLLAGIGLISAVFMLLQVFEHRAPTRRIANEVRVVFVTLGAFSYAALSTEIIEYIWPMTFSRSYFQLPICILAISFAVKGEHDGAITRVFSNFRSVALIALPIALLFCLKTAAAWSGIESSELGPQKIENFRSADSPGAPGKRVVWILFDELDLSALQNKPPGIETPELDTLMAEGFSAVNAYSPNRWTQKSIPSLLTGRPLRSATPLGVDNLSLTFPDDTETTTLDREATIFDDVRAVGGSAAVVGWYHPYTRLFRDKVGVAYWRPDRVPLCGTFVECVAEALGEAFRSLPVENPFEVKVRSEWEELHSPRSVESQSKRHPELRETAKRIAPDRRLDLVYLHFSVPHAPYIGRDGGPSPEEYFGALETADGTLRAVREAMQSNGTWDESVVIVSSDHWWREKEPGSFPHLAEERRQEAAEDKRIPFAVKFPGASEPMRFETPFNTVITRDLIRSIMSGRIGSIAELASAIETILKEGTGRGVRVPDLNEPYSE